MSLMGNLAREAETMAGTAYSGSSTSRAARALEDLAGATTTGSLGSRISAACRRLVLNVSKTPVAQDQSFFVESAGNLEVWTGTSTIGSPIYRMTNVLTVGNDLFDEAQTLTFTNSASGARQSAMVDGSGRTANTVDSLTTGGLEVVSSMMAATNHVSADGTDWIKVESGNGETILALNQIDCCQPAVGDRAYARFTSMSVTAGSKYNIAIYIEKNTLSDTTTVIRETADGNTKSISAGVTGLVSLTWTPTSTGTTGVNIGPGALFGASSGDFFISYFRMTKSSVPSAPFAVGTPVATAYGRDLVKCTPTLGAEGTIFQAFKQYGWTTTTPTGQPAYIFQHFPPTSKLFGVLIQATGGQLVAYGAGATPAITSTVLMDGTLKTMTYDWNGTEIGFAVDDEVRQFGPETETPTGSIHVGNIDSGARAFHGWLYTATFTRKLDAAEREVMRVVTPAKLINLTEQ